MVYLKHITTSKEGVSMKNVVKRLAVFSAFFAVMILFTAVARAEIIGMSGKVELGSYLVDEKGMTLYIFKKDSPGKSVCSGPCLEKWPVFLAEKLQVRCGMNAKKFSTITRDDGKKQTTYKGMPLYYFFKDAKPGDANGQGLNNDWFVASP
jgi:predicted lipoprotein with Yx(FWY)xxD motif